MPYPLIGNAQAVQIQLGDRAVSPVEVSAEVLRHLRARAGLALGGQGGGVVDTLAPGRYRLQADLAGFATIVRDDLQVVVGVEAAGPISMKGAAALPLEPRLLNSLEAGCDLLLLCNDPAQLGKAVNYLQTLRPELTLSAASVTRRLALKRKKLMTGIGSPAVRQTATLLAAELLRFEETLV